MTTRINYRKIWESYNGPIPKDENNRSYEIHHIDGNRNNNEIKNLICLSIQDHYNVHFDQGDYYACASIAKRMTMSDDDIILLSHKIAEANKKRPNPWNDPIIQAKCKETWKKNYKKENHGFFGKKRPVHSEYMKSIGFGKNKSDDHIEKHRKSWIESTKNNPIRAKEWIIYKDGIKITIKNLKKYCRDNDLNFRKIYNGLEDCGVRLA